MHMRLIVAALTGIAGLADAAAAQSPSRIELAPVARADKVFIEGGLSGTTPVAGVVATWRFTEALGLEGEITRAANRMERRYEGWFISYNDDPDATREQIEALAPIARRTLGYEPGWGWAAAFVARGELSPRVTIAGRAGVAPRRYRETSDYVVLSIPEGVDPARVAHDFRGTANGKTRGGFLLGVDVGIALTDRVNLTPELRFVYSGPARIGNKHRELGVGVRAGWRF
jgi:hypothetical protein